MLARLTLPLAVAVVLVLLVAVGPWVLVPVLLPLLLARYRRQVAPYFTLGSVAITVAGVIVLALLVVAVAPTGRLPLPPGLGSLLPPHYLGRPAVTEPITGVTVPQHPHLAANTRSSMHNDSYNSDSYPGPGPLGEQPDVTTRWYGIEECATLLWDASDRLVGLCGDTRGPILEVIDPETLTRLDSMRLPDRPELGDTPLWENLCGGAYAFLDRAGRVVLATSDGRLIRVETADARGEPQLTVTEAVRLPRNLPGDDCVTTMLPDWQGRLWLLTRQGLVLTLDAGADRFARLDLGEPAVNSFAVDEQGPVIVTDEALYRLRADESGTPQVTWRSPYDTGERRKPGQLSQGSGTTPTILADGVVAITDNAEPRMHVVFVDGGTGEQICRAPVFTEGRSATENSLVQVGPTSVVVENNYGYRSPASVTLGRSTEPGMARVDLTAGECEVAWSNDEISAPTSVPKVSLQTGLVYAYTKEPTWWGVGRWYFTGLDARTGRRVFSVRTGTGLAANNHYAAVTLDGEGTAYIATLMGMVRVKDRQR